MSIYTNRLNQSIVVDILYEGKIDDMPALFVMFPSGMTTWVWKHQVQTIY